MIEFEFNPDREKDIPSTWQHLGDIALLTCSNGHTCILSEHTIESTGIVKPSVVCPIDGCDFHAYVVLKDWKIK